MINSISSSRDQLVNCLNLLYQEVKCDITYHKNLDKIQDCINLLTSPLKLMIIGSFSVGKSSFINAILQQSVAQVNATETTAVITVFCYGKQDQVEVCYKDGHKQNMPPNDFFRLTAETTKSDRQQRALIHHVIRYLPIELLKKITIIDSPGLNSSRSDHDEITKSFVNQSDAVIWMFSATNAGGAVETKHLRALNQRLKPLLVVNQIDTLDEEEGDSLEDTLQDLQAEYGNDVLDIVGVSAKMALAGYKQNNDLLLKESNIQSFWNSIEKNIYPKSIIFKLNHFLEIFSKIIPSIIRQKKISDDDDEQLRINEYVTYIANWERSNKIEEILLKIAGLIKNQLTIFTQIDPDQKEINPILKCINKEHEIFKNRISSYFVDALNGVPSAQYNEACICQKEFGRDSIGAIYWLEKAGKNSVLEAQQELYKIYEGKKDTRKAIPWLKLASPNDNNATATLAWIYYKGENNVSVDRKEAIPWLLKVSQQSDQHYNGELSYALGIECLSGEYLPYDEKKAYELFKRSFEDGNKNALEYIATCLYTGSGVAKNLFDAYLTYEKGGYTKKIKDLYIDNPDNYPIQIEIAKNYQNGINGFQCSITNAKKWYEIAYRNGNNQAAYIRAQIETNPNDAYFWYKESASKEYGPAQKIIGDITLYDNKKFSRTRAVLQYIRAIKHGDSSALFPLIKQACILSIQIFIIYAITISPLIFSCIDGSNLIHNLSRANKITLMRPIDSYKDIITGVKIAMNSDSSSIKSISDNDTIEKSFFLPDSYLFVQLDSWLKSNSLNYVPSKRFKDYGKYQVSIYQFKLLGPDNLEELYNNLSNSKNKSVNNKRKITAQKINNIIDENTDLNKFYSSVKLPPKVYSSINEKNGLSLFYCDESKDMIKLVSIFKKGINISAKGSNSRQYYIINYVEFKIPKNELPNYGFSIYTLYAKIISDLKMNNLVK